MENSLYDYKMIISKFIKKLKIMTKTIYFVFINYNFYNFKKL